jgi:hypothetical protein
LHSTPEEKKKTTHEKQTTIPPPREPQLLLQPPPPHQRLYLIVQAPKIVSWLIHPFRNVFFQLFTNDRWIGFDWFFVPRPTVGREQGNKERSVCVHTAQKGIKGALYLFNVGQYFVPMDLEMFLMNSKRLWPETMGLPILT